MRTIIIGDVHGCAHELQELLKKCDYIHKQDRLILVGDLINKGPHNLEVLELCEKLGAESVLGNHETAFIRYNDMKRQDSPKWEKIKAQLGSKLEHYLHYLKRLPLYIVDPEFIVVHAGLSPIHRINETPVRILTTIRTWDGIGQDLNEASDPAWYDLYKEDKLVIYGHWASRGLNVRKNTIGLDSGCVYGEYLSAVILPERKIVQVKAQRVYTQP